MGDSLDQGKRLKREDCDDLTLEMSPDHVNCADHQHTDQEVALHGLEGHLLVQALQIGFSLSNLFLMPFGLGLDYMSIFQFLKFLVHPLKLVYLITGRLLLLSL